MIDVQPRRDARTAPRVLALLALALAGCGDSTGPTPTPPQHRPIQATVAGHLERGGVVALRAAADGRAIPLDSVAWSASPAGAIALLQGDSARLVIAGPVTLMAITGADTGRVDITVAAPPSIVFDNVVDGNRDIWRVALDGQEPARLTDDPADDREPTAAGGRVIFVSYLPGESDLYAVPAAGGAVTRVPVGAGISEPALAPGGNRLAYVRPVSGQARVFVAASDGSDPQRVSSGAHASAVEARPTWSPDGARLVFVSTAGGNADLWLYTVSTGALAPLVATAVPEVDPAWSPDGGRIVFASRRDGETDLYVYTLATGQTARLTTRPGMEGQPAWLPDGRIVFTGWIGETQRLFWIDPAVPAAPTMIETGAGLPAHAAALR